MPEGVLEMVVVEFLAHPNAVEVEDPNNLETTGRIGEQICVAVIDVFFRHTDDPYHRLGTVH